MSPYKFLSGHAGNLPGDLKKRPKAKPAPKVESHLEAGFLLLWQTMCSDYREPERDYHFALPRKWELDFAWPASKVAVEIQGGLFKGHGHQRALAYTRDCQKNNAAVVRGWKLLHYTTLDLKQRPVQVVEEVAALIEAVIKET